MGIFGAVTMSFFLCGFFFSAVVMTVFVGVSFFVSGTEGERIKLFADFENGHTIFLSPIKR
jgi:hypothetical protein